MRFCFVFMMSFVIGSFTTQQLATAESSSQAATSVAVVELFTSEGCSSCPPADELLRRIQGNRTAAGQLIVGISEHVTYWNSLGWKDPYSADIFTNRQTTYAAKLSPEGPYTPQMVLNGRDQFVGSNENALRQALREDLQQQHLGLHILSSAVQANSLEVRFALEGTAHLHPFDIVAVLTDDVDRSNVLRGENAGRDLGHVAVARALTRVSTTSSEAEQSVRIALPATFLVAGSGHHLILFAQEPHQGTIVAAATTPI